jgi:hypothetical protein
VARGASEVSAYAASENTNNPGAPPGGYAGRQPNGASATARSSSCEEVDVFQNHRRLTAQLRGQAIELTRKPEPNPPSSGKAVDPRLMEQLRALVYPK